MAKQPERHLNAAKTHVWIVHPDTDAPWECPVGIADVYVEARGWEFCEAPDLRFKGLFDDVPPAERPEEGDTSFNPADHTVGEVNAHLAEHAVSAPGEVERVLALEVAGKNRATVTDPRPSENQE